MIEKVQDARLLGVQKDTRERYQQVRSWDFNVTEQGWRYHMSDIMAAIGRVQLRRFDEEFRPQRIALARRYRERLSHLKGVQLFEANLGPVVPHIQPIRVLGGMRDHVGRMLLESGIETGIHYKPNHLLSKFGEGSLALPMTESLYLELLTLPLHSDLSFEDVDVVVDTIAESL